MQCCKVAILQLKTNKYIHIYLFTKINKNKAFKLYINYNQEMSMKYGMSLIKNSRDFKI